MITYTKKAGVTSQSVVIRIIDSTDGTPETGVVYTTTGIDIQYRREGAVSTAITEATLAGLDAAYSSGGILHIGNGYYRFDVPDAAFAAGVTGVLIHGTVTGMVVIGCYVQLVAYDPADTVRLGLTALPNAAAEAAGGLYTRGTGAGQINQTVAGLANANLIDIAGAAVSTTTAQLGVNAVKINDVATTSVTTINANLGQTQPVNFTGTAASALVKADMVDIAGAAVSTTTAQVGVNIVKVIGDTIQASSAKTTNWGGTP